MALYLSFLSVFSALAATGDSLSCQTCMIAGSSPCRGQSLPCPPDSACAATYTITTANGSPISEVYTLSCAPLSQCEKPASMSIPNGKIKRGISCCHEENCTPSRPTLPPDNFRVNRQICRFCTSGDSTWCYTSDTMRCTGDENMCLLQTTVISGLESSQVALRGCATKSLCDLGNYSVSSPGFSMDLQFSCTSSSLGVHQGYFLSMLVSIALTTILCRSF